MNTEFLEVDLRLSTGYDITNKATDWARENQLREYRPDAYMGLKVGDVIKFTGGYNNDIRFTSIVNGIDDDGNIYVIWDCYWFPIRPTDKSRDVLKVEQGY